MGPRGVDVVGGGWGGSFIFSIVHADRAANSNRNQQPGGTGPRGCGGRRQQGQGSAGGGSCARPQQHGPGGGGCAGSCLICWEEGTKLKIAPEGGLWRGATSTLPTPQPALGMGQQSGACCWGRAPGVHQPCARAPSPHPHSPHPHSPHPPFPSPPPSQPWAGPGGIETEIWAGPYNETPVCRVPIPAPLLAWPHLCRLSQQQEPAPRRGPSPTGSSPPALVVPGGVLPLLLTPRRCRRAQEVLPALPGPCCFPLIIPH